MYLPTGGIGVCGGERADLKWEEIVDLTAVGQEGQRGYAQRAGESGRHNERKDSSFASPFFSEGRCSEGKDIFSTGGSNPRYRRERPVS